MMVPDAPRITPEWSAVARYWHVHPSGGEVWLCDRPSDRRLGIWVEPRPRRPASRREAAVVQAVRALFAYSHSDSRSLLVGALGDRSLEAREADLAAQVLCDWLRSRAHEEPSP